MKYQLFLDDFRRPDPRQITWVELPTTFDWVTVRNYNQFITCVLENGLPFHVSFDFDLAEEHMRAFIANYQHNSGYLDTAKFQEKTGLDCARWLFKYCLDNKKPLPNWTIHSINHIGREYIKSLLSSFPEKFAAKWH